jgi:GntR family transcriptional regulator, arabinose operon transcriptional repressor
MANNVIQPDQPTSVRTQLRNILLQEIKEGRFTEGGRIPSERDLAERFGISRASVRETITELINAGILFRTVGKGTYIATASARAQATPQTRNVCFFISEDIFHFVQTGYNRILRGVEEACRVNGDRLIFHSVGDSARLPIDESMRLSGCVVVGGLRRSSLDQLKENGIPFVLVDPLLKDAATDVTSVTIDYSGGTRMAIEHLFRLGHRRIGFIGLSGSEKYNAYWQSLEECGLLYSPRHVEFLPAMDLEPGMLAGFHATQKMISRLHLPTALLVTNDYVARGVMEALMVAGVEVPKQVSVVGYDDLGVKTSPPMTTIRVDLDQVGRLAMDALYRRIEGTVVPVGQTLVPVTLVVRGSTTSPASSS